MKTKQLFWGFIFITVGLLILAVRHNWVDINFQYLRDLWPAILIVGGLAVMFKESNIRLAISIVWGILIGAVLFAFAFSFWESDNFYENDESSGDHAAALSAEYNNDIEYASIEINGGVGEFIIAGETDKLYEAFPKGIFENYDADTEVSDDKAFTTFDLNADFNFNNGNVKNKLRLKLNPNPVWNFEFNLAAANSRFDLREFKVKRLDLSSGASKSIIKHGDRFERTNVKIEMGAASVVLYVPRSFGCRVVSNSLLMVKKLPGFIKKSDGNYETDNFDEADEKVYVDIDGGVANFDVRQY